MNTTTPKPEDKRKTPDRRQRNTKYAGKNKRKTPRRAEDKIVARNEAILYYSGLGVGYAIFILIYILIAIKGA